MPLRRHLLLIAATLFPMAGHAMNNTEALALLQGWARETRDAHFTQTLMVDARGDFVARSGGAFFRYSAQPGKLVVSGLVRYNTKMHGKYPDTWQKLLEAGQREQATLGEGSFELYQQPLYEFAPDVVLLSKWFEGNSPSQHQFNMEVRWLLTAATHWRTLRYNRVMQDPEEEVIRQGRLLNERMLKERPRPW